MPGMTFFELYFMTKSDELIQIGFIRGAHALKGQITVHAFSGDEESLTGYGLLFNADRSQSFVFKITGVKQGDFMCSVPGVTDRNAAEALKGTKLYVPASALPETDEDEFYIKDLIGLTALHLNGTVLGTVKNVDSFGAHDALEIEFIHDGQNALPNMQSEFILFTKQNVPELNLAAGTITVDLPDGIFLELKPEEE
jgi:16S rRNA processing protein RimM